MRSLHSMATHWSIVLLATLVRGQLWPWKPQEFASSLTTLCLNMSHVCDPDALLSGEEARALDHELSAIDCQFLGVAFAQQTFHERTKGEHILDPFAKEVLKKWRQNDCHNDLVLFLANDSQEIGLSFGNSSLAIFTVDELTPILTRDYNQKTSFFEFSSLATKKLFALYSERVKNRSDSELWNVLLTVGYLLVIVAIILTACYYCCYRRGEKSRDTGSEMTSELATKYSELRLEERNK